MEHSRETSDLLQENDIISSAERKQIMAQIENDLSDFYDDHSDISQFPVESYGILQPVLIVIFSILISLSFILLFNKFISTQHQIPSSEHSLNTTATEWEILKKYMMESSEKLELKDQEIAQYKIEITNYDRKLTTLKRLLETKEIIEKRLADERAQLLTKGSSQVEIDAKISNLENSLLIRLSPEMTAYYDSSIDDINGEIKQILSEKTQSEEKLRESENEKETLLIEKEIFQENESLIATQNNAVIDMVDKMTLLTKMNAIYENEIEDNQKITDLYNSIFLSLESDEKEQAMEKMDVLLTSLQDKPSSSESLSQQSLQTNTALALKRYLGKELNTPLIKDVDEMEYREIITRLVETTEAILGLENPGEYTPDKLSLDSQIYAIIDVASAMSQLHDKKVPEKAPIPTKEPVRTFEGMELMGTVMVINFNTIIIKSDSAADFQINQEFFVYKNSDTELQTILASGSITDISNNMIFGELKSLSNTENKIAPGNLVFKKVKNPE